MRPWFRWALMAALAASGVVLWTAEQAPRVVAAIDRHNDGDASSSPTRAPSPAVSLSPELQAWTPEPAERDLFAPVAPPSPKQAAASTHVVAPLFTEPSLPEKPPAPAVTYRFLGRMTNPAGEALVFLASADKSRAVKAGDRLDDGYVVESVSDQSVQLVYPDLDVRVAIPLPAAPGS